MQHHPPDGCRFFSRTARAPKHKQRCKWRWNEPLGNWLILLLGSSLAELVDVDIVLVVVASVGNWCETTLTDVLRDDSSVSDHLTFVVAVQSHNRQVNVYYNVLYTCVRSNDVTRTWDPRPSTWVQGQGLNMSRSTAKEENQS